NGDDVADRAVLDLLDRVTHAQVIAPAQTTNDAEVLFLRLGGGFQHAADARRVDGDRLFAEDVLAAFNRRLEVGRAEVGRAAQQHHIGIGGNRLLIGVEADEALVVGDGELLAELFTEIALRAFDGIGESIGQNGQANIRFGVHRVDRSAATTATATHQSDLKNVAAGGVGRAAN